MEFGKKFVAVMWHKCPQPKWDVVPETHVRKVNRQVQALWDKEWLPVKILKESPDPDYLNGLEFTVTGKLLEKNKKHSSAKIKVLEKRKVDRVDKKNADKVRRDMEEELANAGSIFSNHSKSTTRSSGGTGDSSNVPPSKVINDSAHDVLQDEKSPTRNSKRKARGEQTSEPATHPRDAQHQSRSNNQPKKRDSVSNGGFSGRGSNGAGKEKASMPDESAPNRCFMCLNPPTMEIIKYLEELLTHYRRNCPVDAHSTPGHRIFPYQLDGPHKIRLNKNRDIFIDKNAMLYRLEEYRQKPSYLVRALLALLMGKENLVTMTRTGWGSTDAIPMEILLTVELFVFKNTRDCKKLSRQEFKNVVTKYCNRLKTGKSFLDEGDEDSDSTSIPSDKSSRRVLENDALDTFETVADEEEKLLDSDSEPVEEVKDNKPTKTNTTVLISDSEDDEDAGDKVPEGTQPSEKTSSKILDSDESDHEFPEYPIPAYTPQKRNEKKNCIIESEGEESNVSIKKSPRKPTIRKVGRVHPTTESTKYINSLRTKLTQDSKVPGTTVPGNGLGNKDDQEVLDPNPLKRTLDPQAQEPKTFNQESDDREVQASPTRHRECEETFRNRRRNFRESEDDSTKFNGGKKDVHGQGGTSHDDDLKRSGNTLRAQDRDFHPHKVSNPRYRSASRDYDRNYDDLDRRHHRRDYHSREMDYRDQHHRNGFHYRENSPHRYYHPGPDEQYEKYHIKRARSRSTSSERYQQWLEFNHRRDERYDDFGYKMHRRI